MEVDMYLGAFITGDEIITYNKSKNVYGCPECKTSAFNIEKFCKTCGNQLQMYVSQETIVLDNIYDFVKFYDITRNNNSGIFSILTPYNEGKIMKRYESEYTSIAVPFKEEYAPIITNGINKLTEDLEDFISFANSYGVNVYVNYGALQ